MQKTGNRETPDAVLDMTQGSRHEADLGLGVGVPWHGWRCQPGRRCPLQVAASSAASLQMPLAEPEH